MLNTPPGFWTFDPLSSQNILRESQQIKHWFCPAGLVFQYYNKLISKYPQNIKVVSLMLVPDVSAEYTM